MSAEQPPTAEFAISYRQMMLEGLTRELEITKKVIGAIPEDKSGYRPDANARSARELAWHLASADVHLTNGIANLNFKPGSPEEQPKTIAELVGWYDASFKGAIDRVAALSADQLLTPVNFIIYNLPVVYYLGFVNNHSVHHRGELATYLRPMGSKVPKIYGGSFDEPMPRPEPATSAA
jgi:uncharacterized damage-inducible protein DinB